mmetsp:Transcript_25848/g.86897  ORF Transcript_25848/g.86897 Transcript_25848/m.86897 type:complete len:212 (-) Transcript_25848:594-1229(-)
MTLARLALILAVALGVDPGLPDPFGLRVDWPMDDHVPVESLPFFQAPAQAANLALAQRFRGKMRARPLFRWVEPFPEKAMAVFEKTPRWLKCVFTPTDGPRHALAQARPQPGQDLRRALQIRRRRGNGRRDTSKLARVQRRPQDVDPRRALLRVLPGRRVHGRRRFYNSPLVFQAFRRGLRVLPQERHSMGRAAVADKAGEPRGRVRRLRI